MLMELIRRAGKSCRRRGFLRTAWMAPASAIHLLRNHMPGRRRRIEQLRRAQLAFDEEHCVQTANNVLLSDLQIRSGNWVYGNAYEPITSWAFEQVMTAIPIRYEDFTFTDFGSGRGKAVLLATEYPLRRIVGIELSAELHQVAENNLRTFKSARRRCWNVELRNGDALEYPLPEEPTIFFLYNPFEEQVMTPLIERIGQSLRKAPRPTIVLYDTPRHANLWDQCGFLKRLAGNDAFRVWANDLAIQAAANPVG
jgi:hypothetical protein